MDISGWVILNFMTVLLLALLLLFQRGTFNADAGKKFVNLVLMTLALVAAETIGHIGQIYPRELLSWMKIGYFFIYVLDPADYLFAILYINCWLDDSKARLKKEFLLLYRAFFYINLLLIAISELFGLKWFYYFENYEYFRGPFFLTRGAFLLVFCLLLSVYTLINRNSIFPGYVIPIFALPTIAMLGAFLQILFTNLNMTYAAITIGLLIDFFYLQTKNLDVDYLTGALNRRGIDMRMEEQIKNAIAQGQRFSAIMLDLDRFKSINDNYGHSEGDYALKAVAGILYKVFPKGAKIGRYGGDEFCIISDISNSENLEEKVTMIEEELKAWNQKSGKPYELQVSMGHMIYDLDEEMSPKEFQITIDELMYIQKRSHHLQDNRR